MICLGQAELALGLWRWGFLVCMCVWRICGVCPAVASGEQPAMRSLAAESRIRDPHLGPRYLSSQQARGPSMLDASDEDPADLQVHFVPRHGATTFDD